MFREITLINYARPLADRKRSRQHCGPYRWTPSQAPSKGRSFYNSSRGNLVIDEAGSTFKLRLELANDHLRHTRLARTFAYWCDDTGDTTLSPIIARLPRARGFLAGWTMGAGMLGAIDCDIYPDEESAAYAAHNIAERDAEWEREAFSAESADESV